MDVLMELSRILINDHSPDQVICLRERDGVRTFPIRIGGSEADAIERRLKKTPTPRPMTHDLLEIVMDALGGELEKIVIDDLRRLDPAETDQVFIATLHIRRGDERIKIDARPSDSIALGVGLGAPIYVAESVLEAVTKGPSLQEQVEVLAAQRRLLAEHIQKLAARLQDAQFQAETPPAALEKCRRRLKDMKAEYDALGELLRRLA